MISALSLSLFSFCTACVPGSSSTASQSEADSRPVRVVNDDLLEFGPQKVDCQSIQALSGAIPSHRYQLSVMEFPLDWGNPAGEKTKVAFHIFEPRTPDAESAPIIEFTGGPGVNGGISIQNAWSKGVFASYGKNRTMIFFDQRGTAGCSDPFFMELGVDAATARKHAALYASESVIRDVEAFRQSRGIEQWVLSGTSHGSLLVHRYLGMLDEIVSGHGKNPIVRIHAQVDPGTESWRERAALSTLHQYRKSIEQAEADALLLQDPLYVRMLASLQEGDCIHGHCNAVLKAQLLPFRKWLSTDEIAQMEAGYAMGESQGRQVFMEIYATFLSPSEAPADYDSCRLDSITADAVNDRESRASIARCFNSAVNSFDTRDSVDQNFSQGVHCGTLAKLDLKGASRQAFLDMCRGIATVNDPETAYSGPGKPMDLDVLRRNLERFQIPLTIVMGHDDSVSPPESYARELMTLGIDAEAVMSYCYGADPKPATMIWEKGWVKVVEHCDRGHDAMYPVFEP